MKLVFFCLFVQICFSASAQERYFLYSPDYVDTNYKYFEIEYDSLTDLIQVFDPINDPFIYSYEIKNEFKDLYYQFPDSLQLDTVHFNIIDTTFFERTLLYEAKWNDSTRSMSIDFKIDDENFIEPQNPELIFKRFTKQNCQMFPWNPFIANSDYGNRLWNIEWWVKTKFRGKKKLKWFGNKKVFVFTYYYKSSLPKLKWNCSIYFDCQTHLPIALCVEKFKWKLDRDENYLGIDSKKYFRK